MELQAYLEVLKRRWPIAVFIALTVICLGALGSSLISPKYQAKTTLRMETPVGGSSSGPNYQTTFASRLTNTYTQIATSEQLMSELKKQLGVRTLPDIQVSLIPDSEIIQILVESDNPVTAAKTSNALAEMLVSYQDTLLSSTDSNELSVLKDRIDSLKAELSGYQQEHDQLVQRYSQTAAELSVLDRKISLKEGAYQNLVTQYELIVAEVAGVTGRATERQRAALASEIEALEKEFDSLHLQYQALSVESNSHLQQITALRLSMQNAQSTYSNLLNQYDDVQLAHLRQLNAEKIIIVSPAVEPTHPSGTNRSFILGLAVILGLIAGIVTAFAAEYLDHRIYSPGQMEHLISAPLIGSISKSKPQRTPGLPDHDSPLVQRDYWIMCARLQSLIRENSVRTILVTSPNGTEGKSTITYKLALGLAQNSSKVLVVDLNLRTPMQHKLFDVTSDHGLISYLNGEQDNLKSLILKDVRPGIDLLPSPTECGNPLEYLQPSRLSKLFESFKEYDVVLCDTPAFLTFPDALTLSRAINGVLVVAQRGYTTSDDIQIISSQLESMGSRIIGTVFNQNRTRKNTTAYGSKVKQQFRLFKEATASLFRSRSLRRAVSPVGRRSRHN